MTKDVINYNFSTKLIVDHFEKTVTYQTRKLYGGISFSVKQKMKTVFLVVILTLPGKLSGKVILEPNNVNVLEGHSFNISCTSESPQSQYISTTWRKSSSSDVGVVDNTCTTSGFLNDSDLYAVDCISKGDSVSVLVKNVSWDRDGEEWTCEQNSTVSNTTVSNTATVHVVGFPTLTNQPDGSTYTVVENQQTYLTCTVKGGNPPPNITWNCLENQHITTTNNSHVVSRITLIVSRDHSGTLCSCISDHSVIGTQRTTVKIEVLRLSKITSFAVGGHAGQDVVSVSEGDSVSFECHIDGAADNAHLLFRWSSLLREEKNTSNLRYTIDAVSCNQTGGYTCTGRNVYNFGEPSVKQITMLVKCPPRTASVAPASSHVFANLRESMTFSINVWAYPEPNTSDCIWSKLINSEWTQLHSGIHTILAIGGLETELKIANIGEEDLGQYSFSVTNALGSYKKEFLLEVPMSEETKSASSVTGPVVGSIFGVLIVVGLVGGGLFYLKKRHPEMKWSSVTKYIRPKKTVAKTSDAKPSDAKTSETEKTSTEKEENQPKREETYEPIVKEGEQDETYLQMDFDGETRESFYVNT